MSSYFALNHLLEISTVLFGVINVYLVPHKIIVITMIAMIIIAAIYAIILKTYTSAAVIYFNMSATAKRLVTT